MHIKEKLARIDKLKKFTASQFLESYLKSSDGYGHKNYNDLYWKISSWHPSIAVVFHTFPYKFCNFQTIVKSLHYSLKASTFLMC